MVSRSRVSGRRITPRIEETHDPDRATMVFDIVAGPRARIGRVEITAIGGGQPEGVQEIGVRVGDPYDDDAIVRALARYVGDLRERGYYEAQVVHTSSFEPGGGAILRVSVERGPLVSVAFAGDPLPESDRETLVPVRTEGSADEDLLEDAGAAIEDYLRVRGYRDAVVGYTREERGDEADHHLSCHPWAALCGRQRRDRWSGRDSASGTGPR